MAYELLDEAPKGRYEVLDTPKDKSLFDRVSDLSRGYDELKTNLGAGLIRGAGSIGSTLIRPFESAQENAQRRQSIDAGLRELTGANPESFGYGAGKLGGELLGTAGVGNLLAVPFRAAPVVANALQSGGMVAGAKGFMPNLALRAGSGAAVGGASAGLVNPEDANMGAGIGAAAPLVLGGAGRLGSAIYDKVKGSKGNVLAESLGVSGDELTKLATALRNAPESIVPNSRLTVAQALQSQNANTPAVKMLERTVAGGRSGNPLLTQYENQSLARLAALENQGAQTYQGAAKEEATNVGNKLGALLRTQSADSEIANRLAWEKLNQQALREGTTVQLPLAEMEAAMSPLGRGSAEKGLEARRILSLAKDIGTESLPAIKPIGNVKPQQNLEEFIRSSGGMRTDKGLTGESRALSNRQSGTTGLINNKSGKTSQQLAEDAYQRGFISEPDSGVLMQALQGRGGKNIFANDAVNAEQGWQSMAERAMGDTPDAERVLKAIPFAEAQRLRSSLGGISAKAAERGTPAEAKVLKDFESALSKRFDDAASGNLLTGESVSPAFMQNYNSARDATRNWHELYNGGNNISSILRKPYGKDYTLTGDEITNKLWHGGAGLAGDVSNLRNVLSVNNVEPAMNNLRQFIMTDAASKTNASGQFGAALPKYVESRMPGLKEALTSEQLNSLTGVARDIQNAEKAANVVGLRGSDTQAKIDRALGAGLLDSEGLKGLSRFLSVKGVGLESLRGKAAESMIKYKGDTLADLLANPQKAAKALENSAFTKQLNNQEIGLLRSSILRASPLLATD